jgi:hypothetical protein
MLFASMARASDHHFTRWIRHMAGACAVALAGLMLPAAAAETADEHPVVLATGEALGFGLLLNQYDYYFIDKQTYRVTSSTIRRNLRGPFVLDNDPYAINQFLHPYQGATFFGIGRATGEDYWTSLGYSFGGSLAWEIAGEATRPSLNDLISTGIGGAFLGEPLFRMASLLVERGGEEPAAWREWMAALISPPLAFNRLFVGGRYRKPFASRDAPVFATLGLGFANTNYLRGQGVSQVFRPNEAVADFRMVYGMPGKDGYEYARPFDHFDFRFTASTANTFESIMSRGLLTGKRYGAGGDAYRGVWGLWGSYDYIAPQLYRVSSTALALGTAAQWWWSDSLVVQATALGGVGYAAGGTIRGAGERDYHYGAAPQALLEIDLLYDKRWRLDLAARSYDITRVLSTEDRGSERILRLDAALTWRFAGPHGVTLKYVASQRAANYPDLGRRQQRVGTVSLLYTYLFDEKHGHDGIGGMERPGAGSL